MLGIKSKVSNGRNRIDVTLQPEDWCLVFYMVDVYRSRVGKMSKSKSNTLTSPFSIPHSIYFVLIPDSIAFRIHNWKLECIMTSIREGIE